MRALAAVPLLAFALAGCDLGWFSDGVDVHGAPTFVVGAQRARGSLDVAGWSFSTAGATVSWPDDARTLTLDASAPSGLYFLEGAIAGVRGAVPSGSSAGAASEVLVRCIARGPIEASTPSSLVVSGIDVRLDAGTALLDETNAPIALPALRDGMRVEVHGWPETGTRVRASLVRVLPGTPTILVRGWSRAAAVNGAFELSLVQGGDPVLRVEPSGVAVGVPANALVSVAGDAVTSGGIPTLTATRVTVESQFLAREGDHAVVEGIVTGRDLQTLVVGEHAAFVTNAAWVGLESGETPGDVQPGAHVVVEGPMGRDAIDARQVTVVNLRTGAARIVPGSFAVGNPATYAVFDLPGATVVVDATTVLTGPTGAPLTIPQLADLQSGSASGLSVVLRGYDRADGAIQAQQLTVAGG